jgi:phosphatidylglycerol:prolipoprotein diacylglycerol transferase
MRMILLQVGGFRLLADTTMLVLATLFGFVMGAWSAKRLEGIEPRVTVRVMLPLAVATFAGGRLHFLINYPWLPAGYMPWEGIHAGGAVAGLLLAAPAVFAYHRMHPGRMGDALMPAIGGGVFLARIGCFLNGCCFGVQCTYPWCLAFPPGSPASIVQAQQKIVPYEAWSLPVHPLQLYFALTGLAITAVALWLIPRKRYHGQVALVGLLIFSLSAYWLEPLRQDTGLRLYIGRVPQLQIVAGWLVGTALVGLLACEIGHRMLAHRRAARIATG